MQYKKKDKIQQEPKGQSLRAIRVKELNQGCRDNQRRITGDPETG